MKKIISLALVLFLGLESAIFAQSTVAISQAIDSSSKEIATTLPARSKVAVATFFSESKALSNYLSQEVVKKLMARGSLTMIERNEKNLSLVNAETEYQYSGSVSDDSMVEFGNRLGAQYLVYGAFDQLGGMLQFTIQVTNVETAEIPYMKSYSIAKNAQLTELYGDSLEMNSADDYLNAIARCQRKLSSIQKDKNKAIQNQSARISSTYQEQINSVTSEEKNPWESKGEYDNRINEAVDNIVKKRDTELAGVEKSVSIKYDNQLKQVEIQKDKIIKDLQNTTFSLAGKSVQVMLGAFDAEAKPKNWPVSIKSLDKSVSYIYSGKYIVNDADVKTEYQVVEQARKDSDFEGEITYRIIEGSAKNSFEVFVVSVRVYIKSSGSAVINENINKAVGILKANKNVSGASSRTTSVTDNTKQTETYSQKTTVVTTERDYSETTSYSSGSDDSGNPFENVRNFSISKNKGDMNLYDEEIEFEGKTYKALCIEGDTGIQATDWSNYWGIGCWGNAGGMNDFMKSGNTIKFKCIGDGRKWRITLKLYDDDYTKASFFIFEFNTKKGKMTEITIPYEKFKFDWSVRRKFDKDQIMGVEFYAYNIGTHAKRSLKIFDVRVY
ncbi:MAG: hypothetical protein SPL22_14810 [Treponema sp.]|uniref:hypothetical protein n=1 Tax=Treponema sp. TaxID=166 RepID=UPI002A9143B3|nr:hypothetical protein [Treponema sp.]MDY6398982.1 hypothetical protein [Treponema sp.]